MPRRKKRAPSHARNAFTDDVESAVITAQQTLTEELKNLFRHVPVSAIPHVNQLSTTIEEVLSKLTKTMEQSHAQRVALLAEVWFRAHPARLVDVLNQHVEAALAKNEGMVTATAKQLGIHRRQLQRRLAMMRKKKSKRFGPRG